MLARLNSVVPKGTSVVILQPGGNDRRKGASDNTPEIQSRLSAMGIKVVLVHGANNWVLIVVAGGAIEIRQRIETK